MRALRVDKMTLAALEATLRLALDPARASARIPLWASLATTPGIAPGPGRSGWPPPSGTRWAWRPRWSSRPRSSVAGARRPSRSRRRRSRSAPLPRPVRVRGGLGPGAPGWRPAGRDESPGGCRPVRPPGRGRVRGPAHHRRRRRHPGRRAAPPGAAEPGRSPAIVAGGASRYPLKAGIGVDPCPCAHGRAVGAGEKRTCDCADFASMGWTSSASTRTTGSSPHPSGRRGRMAWPPGWNSSSPSPRVSSTSCPPMASRSGRSGRWPGGSPVSTTSPSTSYRSRPTR